MSTICEDYDLGLSRLIPAVAAEILARSAADARRYPQGSVDRVRIIDDAILKVKRMFPECFKTPEPPAEARLFD